MFRKNVRNNQQLNALLMLHILITVSASQKDGRPNIIVIIGDDLGWNDVSFHGSDQISTPNIDALGVNGVFLKNHYSMQVCTPSRAAFLTGQYPIRFGYQGYPLKLGVNQWIPKHLATLPKSMKRLGYQTHLIGKWHLGHAKKAYTPLAYGYDSHFGYWNGYIGYFDHSVSSFNKYNGTDFHDQLKPVNDVAGQYATDLFTSRALEIIQQHNPTTPLFLVVSHLAAHTGKTLTGIETVLEVRNITATNEKYSFIEDLNRRMYAEIIEDMDKSVGQIIKSLSEKDMLENSIIAFFSDNGAPTYGVHANSGSNYPLRGIKMTMYEGAIRTPAAIFAPQFRDKGRSWPHLFHVTDWMPTLYSAAGGDLSDLGLIDGVDQWQGIVQDVLKPIREELLVDIDSTFNYSAFIDYDGRFKLIQNSYFSANFSGDQGFEANEHHFKAVSESVAFQFLSPLNEKSIDFSSINKLREQMRIKCLSKNSNYTSDEDSLRAAITPCTDLCLYDLWEDPCEYFDVASKYPHVVQSMWKKVQEFVLQVVPKPNLDFDANADPKFCNHTWFNWLDDDGCWYNHPDNVSSPAYD